MKTENAHPELEIDMVPLKRASHIVRALNHKLRQKILRLVHAHERMSVSEIVDALKVRQSVASQQLAILRHAELVKAEREGKNVFYLVNYNRLDEINKLVCSISNA